MADLGFLPAVQRLLQQTRRGGQRMLFSATLDAAVNGLVKRFLNNPATHERTRRSRRSRPWRTTCCMCTATADPGAGRPDQRARPDARVHPDQARRQGAGEATQRPRRTGRRAARQPRQGARTRNMDAFSSGAASTMVATDIAARGIHVDDIMLVVHADPPIEHKAYLHRSGRTARAGNDGTVDHADDRRPGPRRAFADPGGRHQPDHDQDQQRRPPDAP